MRSAHTHNVFSSLKGGVHIAGPEALWSYREGKQGLTIVWIASTHSDLQDILIYVHVTGLGR